MPPSRPIRGDGKKAKNPKKTFLRLLKYLLEYKFHIAMVLVCIFAHALVHSRSAVMLGTLVDDYILPMVKSGSQDFGPLLKFLLQMLIIFLTGIATTFLQSYLMVPVTQGIQKKLRDELFTKMQTLPCAISTPTLPATSCPATPATLTPCGR